MGHENDYNSGLKSRRLPAAARARLLCAEQRDGEIPRPDADPGEIGHIETLVKRETEQAIAARLAALELLDPSQKRPTPRANILNRVDYIDL